MSISHEALRLRQLANAIETRDAVAQFLENYGAQIPNSIHISWSAAGSCPGYEETRKAVAEVIRKWWPTISANAINAVESNLIDARKQLTGSPAPGNPEGDK